MYGFTDLPPPRDAGPSVLVVDPDPATREILGLYLQTHGLHVYASDSQRQAIPLLREFLPDLLVTEMRFHDGAGGGWLLGALRSDPLLSWIRVFVFTTEARADEEVRLLEVGADGFLRKPAEPQEVMRRIQTLLTLPRDEGDGADDEEAGAGRGAPTAGPASATAASREGVDAPVLGVRPLYPPRRRRVLVAEDDDVLRGMVVRRLRRDGFVVRSVERGDRAVSVIAQWLPDLVLLNLVLPELDGWSAAQMLRRSPRTAGIPTVLMTGYPTGSLGSSAATAGFAGFLPKPFDLERMLQTVQANLSRAS